MEVQTIGYKHCDLVKAAGRIDSYTAPDLEKALNAITDSGKYKIVFDMSDVNFVSSKGWWVMIETQKKCKRYRRGELVIANICDEIRESLNLVGMGKYFKIFADVTAAVGNF